MRGKRSSRIAFGAIVVALAVVVLVAVLSSTWSDSDTPAQQAQSSPDTMQSAEEATNSPDEMTAEVQEPAAPLFDSAAITRALETWAASTPGTKSVVISDIDDTILASTNPDQQYFGASIYKLYVAYEGYKQIDSGEVSPSEIYVNNNTRLDCLDLMIRESDSPCAEKWWVELGVDDTTAQLEEYGLTNTAMASIRTSAADAALMLSRIARGEGLSPESHKRFLQSMETQIFRDALNKGFSDDVIVYNKIGFNGLVEYHDVAIVQLSDGRQLVVSVLTERVGTRTIAALAEQLEAAITQ